MITGISNRFVMNIDYAVDCWAYRIGNLEQAVRFHSGLVIGAFSLGLSPLKHVYPYMSRRKTLALPSRINLGEAGVLN